MVVGGLLLAGTVVLVTSGHGPWSAPRASIGGAPLTSGMTAAEAAAFASLAHATPIPGPAAPKPAAPVDLASLAKVFDPDKIARQGDAYVATLADGRRARLTIDPQLQAAAERLLDEARAPRAAIVAMTPDGTVLALAGRLASDPEKGSRTGTFDWRHATEVWAPGASIFKLVTASALLRVGVDPDGKVCYHGGLRSVLERNLRDDRRDSRCDSLTYGVAHSQNAILGKLAFQKLEPASLEAEAKLLGWNAPVAGELAGVAAAAGELAIPQTHDLEFARAAAGFTGARLSVLGGALLAATFAAGGEQPAARLIASVEGTPVAPAPPRRVLAAETARSIARMMAGTCDDGSAARVFGKHRKLRVAGKTGTLSSSKPHHIEHSWFVGFAPAAEPEIVVSVLIGNSENWHLRGHEVARRLLDRALAPATAREKGRSAAPVRAEVTAERARPGAGSGGNR